MEDDWDLHAVVRGCTSTLTTITASTTTTTTSSSVSSSKNPPSTSCNFSIFPPDKTGQVLSLSKPFEAKSSIEELHELCKPFFFKSHPQIQPFQTSSPLSSFSYSSTPKSPPIQHQEQKQSNNKPYHHTSSATTPRSKRRRNQLKKVCQVPAENLSSDIWTWRKYGQKPIKGSPYPRGYYRCSSSKGCLARKQVERNKSEPTMFIVTYTGEHSHPAPTHRNSLAGSTRHKTQTPTNGESEAKSPATSGVDEEVAPKSEDIEDLMKDDADDDEEQNQFGVSDMEDFFEGLEELSDPFTASSNVIASATAFGGT